jgi:anthranilate phosphoribosyltransferase
MDFGRRHLEPTTELGSPLQEPPIPSESIPFSSKVQPGDRLATPQTSSIKESLSSLLANRNLTRKQAEECMKEILSGQATPSQIGAFLVALRKKGETVEEVTALARTMINFSRRIHPKVGDFLVDTCGTGGDRVKTFNVSTTCAFVVAAAGIPVAKHGNRSFTSKCGSADVLEQLGLNLNMEPERVRESIEQVGIGFMFAPNFHPAMKNVAGIRKEIGVRTIFNILGPLTNPAGANAQLLGVYDMELLEPMARAAMALGAKSVMTVHGLDGTDEISLAGKTAIVYAKNDGMTLDEIEAEDLGLSKTAAEEVGGSDPEQNARLTARILSGKMDRDDPRVQIVLANSAAALVVSEKAHDLKEGVEIGANIIDEGSGLLTLQKLVEFSGGNMQPLKNLV